MAKKTDLKSFVTLTAYLLILFVGIIFASKINFGYSPIIEGANIGGLSLNLIVISTLAILGITIYKLIFDRRGIPILLGFWIFWAYVNFLNPTTCANGSCISQITNVAAGYVYIVLGIIGAYFSLQNTKYLGGAS